jgi:biopolymer transport protein ExbB
MSRHKTRAALLPFLLGALLLPAVASAWWNDEWNFRKEITLDLSPAGAAVSTDINDVPVLLRLSLANFEYFGDAKADGSDLRLISADDKTPLAFHLERYDAAAQMAFIWVRLPRLAAGANTEKIYLYYGNENATSAADSGATYDKNQALVYHFGAAAGSPQDATAYKSEPSIFQAEVNPAALIGAGARFNGTSSITIPAAGALQLQPGQGMTFSAWVRLEQPQQPESYVISLSTEVIELNLGVDGLLPFVALTGLGEPLRAAGSTPLVAGEWNHLALRMGEGKLELLVNGDVSASIAAEAPLIAGTLSVGASPRNQNHLIGELDELQVSNTARSAAWLRAAAASQGMVAPLVAYGSDVQKEAAAEGGYFATTLRNVTVDGWIVIGLCVLLLFMSIAIMITKMLFLNRVVKGNTQFLNEFRKLTGDVTGLDPANGKGDDESAFETGAESQLMSALGTSGERFGISTLFRLYHHGVREVRHRLEGQAAGADRARILSSQSIEAIRATMDASMTRITQRLSSQMVWLTISISGGPFLGLLGTVIGVMITFAAIAQAGDVNVNAIAPGTAAALVATVAGLGVAIPCLFGYNYLNTRIKEVVADMRVFVDEFVTRIAETYS